MVIKADKQIKRRSMLGEVVSRLLRNRTAMSGLIILITVVLLCVCAGIICPEGYNFQNIEDRFQLPNKKYLLGTDELGRSLLARVLYGGRLSLLIGVVSTLIAAVLGVALGAIAAYFGSLVDDVMMRILDIFSSIPSLLMAIAISATLGSNIFNCMLAVGISSVPSFARMVRGPVLAIMHQEYIEAAHAIDARDSRIIAFHVIPNVLSPIIVQLTMCLASSILLAASLSFLGLGVQPPTPEWGSLLSNSRQYIRQYPYLVTAPGIAIALTVLSMNLFGDGLRDAMDPRLKN
jgi:ABC-type dipeptide/oligopeptide/nickel transport system permease subunit